MNNNMNCAIKVGCMNSNYRRVLNQRRARVCQLQKKIIIMLMAFFLIIAGVMLGSNMLASSRSNAANEAVLYKYYTSIEVKSGDTLWTIADEYISNNKDMNKTDYINEVISMNQLGDGAIHAGDYITVPYYSYDFK